MDFLVNDREVAGVQKIAGFWKMRAWHDSQMPPERKDFKSSVKNVSDHIQFGWTFMHKCVIHSERSESASQA